MKYQALRRKLDKQWMRFDYSTITEVSEPVKTSLERIPHYLPGSYINWSLYEIVTVHVLPEDEIPTDNDLLQVIKDSMVIGETPEMVTLAFNPKAIVNKIKSLFKL